MEQLLAHVAGDYLLQNKWMALEKVHRWFPAFVHGAVYSLPFLFITTEPAAIAIIAGTHVVIDRYRVAKWAMWVKELISPKKYRPSWKQMKKSAYREDFWLMVVTDNSIHMIINFFAIQRFG